MMDKKIQDDLKQQQQQMHMNIDMDIGPDIDGKIVTRGSTKSK